MKITCSKADHLNKQITWVCTNPRCSKGHLLCSMCFGEHDDCAEFTLRIEDIMNGNNMSSMNLITDRRIKEVFLLLEQHGVEADNESLLKVFEELVTKQFDGILQNFTLKINETKEHMLQNARQLFTQTKFDLKTFKSQIDSVYNIESLKNLLTDTEETKTLEAANKEVESFLKEINEKTKGVELQEMVKTISEFTGQFVEIDQRLFDEFKKSISFQIFDGYPKVMKMLSWDPFQKSKAITLRNDCMIAQKEVLSRWDTRGDTAIIGNRTMSRGWHKWIVEVQTQGPFAVKTNQLVVFGVVENRLVSDLERFSVKRGVGITTMGQTCQMTFRHKLDDFDNKVYVCNLDMEEGVFTIMHNGQVIAEASNLKGKTMVPFAYLNLGYNIVKLKPCITI